MSWYFWSRFLSLVKDRLAPPSNWISIETFVDGGFGVDWLVKYLMENGDGSTLCSTLSMGKESWMDGGIGG
jgi:hypothetical protein